eukprot:136044-Rhodomonas_salina.1
MVEAIKEVLFFSRMSELVMTRLTGSGSAKRMRVPVLLKTSQCGKPQVRAKRGEIKHNTGTTCTLCAKTVLSLL